VGLDDKTGWLIDHKLRGSSSPVLTATGFVSGRWQFSTPPPQNPHPLTDNQKISCWWLRRRPLRLCQIWWKSVHGRGFWANGWNITRFLFIYLFIYTFFPELTYRSDSSTDFHAWWLKERGLAPRVCLLGVSLILFPILGVKSPKTPKIWGANKRFQAKRAKYWKFHVIETTSSISTKFCTTIETTKWSSSVVPMGANKSKMADGRHFEKKTVKSIYLQPLDRFWWNLWRWRILSHYSGSTVKIFNFWKSKMATAAILKITKNRDISAMGWPIFTQFGMVVKMGLLTAQTVKKLNFNNPRRQTTVILITVKSPYLCNLLTDFDKVWHDDAWWSPAPGLKFKFLILDNLIS